MPSPAWEGRAGSGAGFRSAKLFSPRSWLPIMPTEWKIHLISLEGSCIIRNIATYSAPKRRTEGMGRKVLIVALGGILIGAMLSLAATSNTPTISDIFVSSDDRALLLFSRVKGVFTPEVEEAIESGVPTTFIFHLKLQQKRRFWLDKELVSKEIRHVLKYDPLKKEFHFSAINGPVTSTRTTREPREAKRWMTELRGEPIIPSYVLRVGHEYYVKMKVEIKTVEFSFPLKQLLFFLSPGHLSTAWIESSPFRFSDLALHSQK
ncbi:MAG: DUF4390 domain-containing protein [Nitrospinota bacterium]|nr:MAG: DUF4390 domain-containing protein [Nitrospinota bacterium]